MILTPGPSGFGNSELHVLILLQIQDAREEFASNQLKAWRWCSCNESSVEALLTSVSLHSYLYREILLHALWPERVAIRVQVDAQDARDFVLCVVDSNWGCQRRGFSDTQSHGRPC